VIFDLSDVTLIRMTGFVQKVVIFEKSEKVKKHDKNEPNIKE
jgi:hypothetical protein